MHRSQRVMLLVLLALALLGISCFLVRIAIIRVTSPDYVRITEFVACEGPDPITGLPKNPITTAPSSMEKIYVCGYVEVDREVSLAFLIRDEANNRDWIAPSRRYQTGYVFEEIPKRFWHNPGHYLIEAWWNRAHLASMEFQVVEEAE